MLRPLALLAAVLLSVPGLPQDKGAPLPRKAAFGAQLLPLTPEQRAAAKLGEGEGIALGAITAGQSADLAKFKPGDIVLSADGKPVKTPQEFIAVFRAKTAVDKMTLDVIRGGKRETVTIPLVERPRQKPDGFDVVYDQVLSQGKRIRLILTHPHKPGKFPVVMLIGGIGAYSVDGDFKNIAYGNIMEPIAKGDYVTARIDKPGLGDSEGPIYTELPFSMELDAYRQALKALPGYDFIDPNKICIFGHSMGGAFGPIVASEQKLLGVCVGGTVSKTWGEYFIENTRRQAQLGGMPPAQVGAYIRRVAAFQHYLFYEGLSPEEIAKARPELADTAREQVPDGKTYSGVGIPFFRELCGYNFEELWTKIDARVLAMWGENDFISTEVDHEMIAAIANRKKADSGKYVRLEKTDHGFNTTTSLLDSLQKWGRGGAPFNSKVVDVMRDWLK